MKITLKIFAVYFIFLIGIAFTAAEDILIADFEGETYAPGWKTEGTAFGNRPAQGTLKSQMQVTGFLGKGLVNSYLEGDNSTGKLTSPPFKIERPFLSFLLGGGGHQGLAVNLLIEDKVVRTATGPNTIPGGSEHLDWFDWNVTEFQGKDAVIEIIDDAKGGWGHINVDQIIQTDQQKKPVEKKADFVVQKEFLHIPITMDAPTTWVRIEADGVWQQEFDCPLTIEGTPDFYANLQIGQWKGKTLTLIAEKIPANSKGLEMIQQNGKMSHEETIYTEKLRPQFHFTARTGWINDPNGLLYYNGVWHLFFQHNPYSTRWGNMTWGHATSPDLLHWTESPAAIHPDKLGTIFSGSGIVDWNNTSGFQNGNEKPLVLIYTADGGSARFGAKTSQCMAYSIDGGKTFTKYDKNPIIPHIIGGNRDPKVIWHEPSKQWILALYMDKEDYALFASKDLKKWDKLCDIENLGCSECPDFYPLAVDGDSKNIKWVFWGGNGKYIIGSFDGKEFKPETEPLTNKYGGSDYAAMTFSDVMDGRRIQLSWMNTWGEESPFAGMPFNHQFTVPRNLTLRTTPQGIRLFMEPVKELETLREKYHEYKFTTPVEPQKETLIKCEEILFDTEMIFDVSKTNKLILNAADQKIEYNVIEKQIFLEGIRAPLVLQNGKLKLRLVIDRTSIELFAQEGEVQIAKCFLPKKDTKEIVVSCEGGQVVIEDAKIWKMKSVWNQNEKKLSL